MSPDYRVYPSLLDRFQSLLDSETDAEGFWNIDSVTGEMRRTADEIAAERERGLLDAINRVPTGPIEAADRGTCFNEIVDCIIAGRNTLRDDIVISSGWLDEAGEFVSGKRGDSHSRNVIRSEMDGFVFHFDAGLCRGAAEYFGRNAIPQHFCKGMLRTGAGLVELYGYADEIVRDKVYDLKTTSSYQFGKYERGWQKLVYPYCLVRSGEMLSVSSFEYTVFQLSRPAPAITGKLYREEYTYDHSYAEERLRLMMEVFIGWIEEHREQITDTKIFGGNVYHKQRADGACAQAL